MLTVEEAKDLLIRAVGKSAPVTTGLPGAYGNVVAEDIYAPVDLPLFDASSVDGYALCLDPSEHNRLYKIIGEIKAGDAPYFQLPPGEGVRLYTGAMVPASADCIVMQENVEAKDGYIKLAEDTSPGNYIRKQGSQIRKGELALAKGAYLNPGTVGFLASMGLANVKIYKKPPVSVIVTGNEIIAPGNDLKAGQIYESNSFALIAALGQMQINPVHVLHAEDTRENLDAQLVRAIGDSDIILITGGISVGKYDLVYDALKDAGAETVFYKVAQRPGKPLWFGKIGEKLIFALPGNPASVLVCFYEYVYPAIRIMRGIFEPLLPVKQLKLLKEIHDPGARASFLRAKITGEGVTALEKQDSGMMMSFAGGNALIYIPKEISHVAENEIVEVHLLPFDN
jgi:molybdopterin molybdotransferase